MKNISKQVFISNIQLDDLLPDSAIKDRRNSLLLSLICFSYEFFGLDVSGINSTISINDNTVYIPYVIYAGSLYFLVSFYLKVTSSLSGFPCTVLITNFTHKAKRLVSKLPQPSEQKLFKLPLKKSDLETLISLTESMQGGLSSKSSNSDISSVQTHGINLLKIIKSIEVSNNHKPIDIIRRLEESMARNCNHLIVSVDLYDSLRVSLPLIHKAQDLHLHDSLLLPTDHRRTLLNYTLDSKSYYESPDHPELRKLIRSQCRLSFISSKAFFISILPPFFVFGLATATISPLLS